jgi:hypothetical protein
VTYEGNAVLVEEIASHAYIQLATLSEQTHTFNPRLDFVQHFGIVNLVCQQVVCSPNELLEAFCQTRDGFGLSTEVGAFTLAAQIMTGRTKVYIVLAEHTECIGTGGHQSSQCTFP